MSLKRGYNGVVIITDKRYNLIKDTVMNLNELIKKKNITKYKLSKISGVPFTTISEITTGKSQIKNCTGETLYRLAKALGITTDALLEESMAYRSDFETYKSNICHMVKDMGDMDFIIDVLEQDKIRKLYNKKWFLESLYLLAMTDYLCRINNLPLSAEYNDIRSTKLSEPVYPSGILIMSEIMKSDSLKQEGITEAIPEFRRFNIIESDIRNVY